VKLDLVATNRHSGKDSCCDAHAAIIVGLRPTLPGNWRIFTLTWGSIFFA